MDFEKWCNNGAPSGKVTFGAPIELNLGGRGIRSICKKTNNQYIIIAGAFDGTNYFALYHWSGQATEAPVADTDIDLHELNREGIVEVPTPLLRGSNIDLISDNGTENWYNDDTESKDLKVFEFQKFAGTQISLNKIITSLIIENTTTDTWQTYPNPASEFIILSLKDISGAHMISLSDLYGKVVLETQGEHQGQNTIKVALENILPGLYILKVEGDAYSLKVSVK